MSHTIWNHVQYFLVLILHINGPLETHQPNLLLTQRERERERKREGESVAFVCLYFLHLHYLLNSRWTKWSTKQPKYVFLWSRSSPTKGWREGEHLTGGQKHDSPCLIGINIPTQQLIIIYTACLLSSCEGCQSAARQRKVGGRQQPV